MYKEYRFNIEEIKTQKSKYLHIGIPGLTYEIQNEKMILFAGTSGIGKTKFMARIINGACLNNLKVAFFSLGVSRKRIIELLVNVLINNPKIKKKVQQEKTNNIDNIYDFLSKYNYTKYLENCYVFDNLYSSIEIYNNILNLDRKTNGIDLVIIDGIHEIMDYSDGAKEKIIQFLNLCNKSNIKYIFTIDVCQSCNFRENKRPEVYDINYQENIKKYFNKIITLYRNKCCFRKEKEDILELDVFTKLDGVFEKTKTIETLFY